MAQRQSSTKSNRINPFRERCRSFIASHPKLHPSHKVILMRMTDYVNRDCYEAFVGEKTLAQDCGVDRRSIQRAKKTAIEHGILECTRKGNQYIGANRYVFKVPNARDTGPGSAGDTFASAGDTL
jgi:hypothetical protein